MPLPLLLHDEPLHQSGPANPLLSLSVSSHNLGSPQSGPSPRSASVPFPPPLIPSPSHSAASSLALSNYHPANQLAGPTPSFSYPPFLTPGTREADSDNQNFATLSNSSVSEGPQPMNSAVVDIVGAMQNLIYHQPTLQQPAMLWQQPTTQYSTMQQPTMNYAAMQQPTTQHPAAPPAVQQPPTHYAVQQPTMQHHAAPPAIHYSAMQPVIQQPTMLLSPWQQPPMQYSVTQHPAIQQLPMQPPPMHQPSMQLSQQPGPPTQQPSMSAEISAVTHATEIIFAAEYLSQEEKLHLYMYYSRRPTEAAPLSRLDADTRRVIFSRILKGL